jgi:hypothetical protein
MIDTHVSHKADQCTGSKFRMDAYDSTPSRSDARAKVEATVGCKVFNIMTTRHARPEQNRLSDTHQG